MLKNHYNPTKEQQDCHVLSGVTKSQPVLDPMLQHHHNPIEERQHYHVLSGMTRGHPVFGEGKNLQKNSEYNILESSYGNSAQGISASTLSVSLLPCDQCKMSFPGEIDLINHLLIHELENLKHGGDRDEPILICKPTFWLWTAYVKHEVKVVQILYVIVVSQFYKMFLHLSLNEPILICKPTFWLKA